MGYAIRDRIQEALMKACGLSSADCPPIIIERPRKRGHGDLSTNIALILAKEGKGDAAGIARNITSALQAMPDLSPSLCERVEIAGGFINFHLSEKALQEQLAAILKEGERYGLKEAGRPRKIRMEFVSANPTGPLTVAHGRQAAVGDSLARILKRAGWAVTREYYLNDKGKQIRLLGLSTLARYRELFGEKAEIPADGYHGGYLSELAAGVRERDGEKWLKAPEGEAVDFFSDHAAREINMMIKKDLEDFRVTFDKWTSEREFSKSGKIEECLSALRSKGYLYEKDEALWFRSSELGDDKDRVLVKGDGDMTYFTPDIAYHREKFESGSERVIDFWGPDHHGYVSRMKAAVKALGYDEKRFTPVIVQLTTLYRGTQKLSMSTRAGEFVTLREVMNEVGVDAARYFFVRMRTGSHLDFDLELAKKHSSDNPVYYVQYVHARVCSMFNRLAEKMPDFSLPPWGDAPLHLLCEEEELDVIKSLAEFPFMVERSARTLEPHQVCNYLEELAEVFHRCYTVHTVISEDRDLTAARMALAEGVRTIVRIGLDLLGVSAPERM